MIAIVATGGTIAGMAPQGETHYQAGVLPVSALLDAVPEILSVADVQTFQPFSIDSSHAHPSHWQTLAHEVQCLLDREDMSGVVITHGTDTLEETAFYLHLVLNTAKPVVLVGAMRPANALSADGPNNLRDAVLVACHRQAIDQGVLVVMNQKVYSARDVIKGDTQDVASFMGANTGPLGLIYGQQIAWCHELRSKHTRAAPFSIDSSLAKVEILLTYPGQELSMFYDIVSTGVRGVVVAGMGNGSCSPEVEALISHWVQQGVWVIKGSRVPQGVVHTQSLDGAHRVLNASSLSPYKARVLLMLLLGANPSASEITQQVWDDY